MINLSVIIPLHNEEEVLPLLFERVKKSSKNWGEYEVIFVNDGSADSTWKLLEGEIAKTNTFRAINFSRNFGHQAAMTAGLETAQGRAIVMMDGDLQDPPELIEKMLGLWQAGNNIVYAVSENRKESLFMRICYKLFYRVLRYLSDIKIPLDSGDFCLMDRMVVDTLNAMPEKNRFIRGLRVWVGFSKVALPYDRGERVAGETKYPLMRLVKFGLAGIMAFSTKPLELAVYAGVTIASLSFLGGLVVIVLRLLTPFNVAGWASMALIIFFMGGIQLFFLGIIGQYIGLIYNETKKRPTYIIDQKL